MSRNHEVTDKQLLLNENGELREPGWSRTMVQEYRRDMIKAPQWRIKEWDYYLVLGDEFGAAFTISDDGYIGLQSVSLLCFGEHLWEHTETVLNAFPMGKLNLPQDSSQGVTEYRDKRLHMRFTAGEGSRRIQCIFRNFHEGKLLKCDITLRQPDMDSMVIATPWDERHAFYYNQKINCMRASGYVLFDGRKYEFNPEVMRLTVMGGGACILKHFWNGENCRVQFIEDICATAKGYELLALNNLKRRDA